MRTSSFDIKPSPLKSYLLEYYRICLLRITPVSFRVGTINLHVEGQTHPGIKFADEHLDHIFDEALLCD